MIQPASASQAQENGLEQEARAILLPILQQLQRLKKTTPENQPPPHRNIKVKSHKERMRAVLIPIGKFILAKIRGRPGPEHGKIELAIWYVISTTGSISVRLHLAF
jgi:hypothetical protein